MIELANKMTGFPLIGNVGQLPTTFVWYKFTEWCNLYGPLVKFNLAGRDHVIVNTEKIANDLMRERGNIYSSRPQVPMAAQLLSQNMRPVLLPYGDVWRNGRKLMHHLAMPAAAKNYEPIQEEESVRVLHELLHDSARYEKWFERYAAGLIMRLAFGETIVTGEEEAVRRIYVVLDNLSRLINPVGYLVNIFPVLMHLPAWMAPFKREAARLHAEEMDLFSSLVKTVERRLAKGDAEAKKTFSARWLEDKQTYGLTDGQAYYVLGTLFEAGAGTTAAAMMSFTLAMILYPDKFQQLKAEIDQVVGPGRLPTFEDFPDLPYMRACVKETLRWRPVTPTNIPHELIRDDIYDGYKLKQGTIIQVNQWVSTPSSHVLPYAWYSG
jgi:cytochrome P450